MYGVAVTHPPIQSHKHSFIHPLTHPFTHTYSLTHSLTHTYSLIHSLTLTHSAKPIQKPASHLTYTCLQCGMPGPQYRTVRDPVLLTARKPQAASTAVVNTCLVTRDSGIWYQTFPGRKRVTHHFYRGNKMGKNDIPDLVY